MKVDLYDTTLRDGAQAENVSFSLEDKLRVAQELDYLGVTHIEGGWPGSNPKDVEFFERMKDISLENARLAAFGSTRHTQNAPEDDPNLNALLDADTPAITIFGKSWGLHVTEALQVGLDVNLDLIESSVRYLKDHDREVIYDAEHYFDAFFDDPDYALETVQRAEQAGADTICLCETNGGRLPQEVAEVVQKTREVLTAPLGIHAHNDSACAVANSLIAFNEGARHIQGTINGIGERCGNADFTAVIPNLELKLGVETIGEEKLRHLRQTSLFVYELANLSPDRRKPFVGSSAFAHKGGVHVSAIRRNPRTYEHIEPEKVGNSRKVLVSELSGKSNVLQKADELGLNLDEDTDDARRVVEEVKKLESQGYQFEAAEGSFEILVNRVLGRHKVYFKLVGFRVISEQNGEEDRCEATIRVRVGDRYEHTAADGVGPVNALDNALRKALNQFYPELQEVRLTDFKVRVLDEKAGTEAKVRVLCEMTDGNESWGTVGVSDNVIEASWESLTDGIDYKLMRTRDEALE